MSEEDKNRIDNESQEKYAHFLMLKAYNALNDFVSYACCNSVFNDKVKQAQEIRDAISALANAIEKSMK